MALKESWTRWVSIATGLQYSILVASCSLCQLSEGYISCITTSRTSLLGHRPTLKVRHMKMKGRSSSLLPSRLSSSLPSSRLTTLSLSSTPEEEEAAFFDGYDEFISSLQEDLDNDGGDMDAVYDNNREDWTKVSTQSSAMSSSSRGAGYTYRDDGDWSTSGGGGNGRNREGRKHYPNYKPFRGYQRDPLDDMNNVVDEKTVKSLIKLRSKAQRKGDFDLADELRDELNNVHGVYVWDKDSLWTTSPASPSKKRNRSHGGSNDWNNNNRNTGRKTETKTFGRYGHDYTQIGDGINPQFCTLQLNEIHALLAKRLSYKLLKKYHKADEILRELFGQGVHVHDKLLQWRADGGTFADLDSSTLGVPFTQNKYSEPVQDQGIISEIENLVNLRLIARSRKEYDKADSVRDELWAKYRVAVDDKTCTWSVGGDFGPNGAFRWTDDGPINPRRDTEFKSSDWRDSGMYSQSPYSEPLEDGEDEEEIMNLIHDRLEAKRVKDYNIADYIRDHLYEQYNISVDDRLRQWSVGGSFGEDAQALLRAESPTSAIGKVVSEYVKVYNRRGGTGHLTEKDLAIVEAMIQRRAEEKARHNPKAAESIRNGLKNKFYVIIDDQNGEWHVRGNHYVLSPQFKGSLPPAVEAAKKEIEMLIRERTQAKFEKDYNRADEIRSDLFEAFGIKIDDRLKEWTIVEGVAEDKNRGSKFTSQLDEDDDFLSINNEDDSSKVSTGGWGMDIETTDLVEDNKKIVVKDDLKSTDPSASETDGLEMSAESLSNLTVPKLKERLREAGLPVSGKKAELIDRLLANSQ